MRDDVTDTSAIDNLNVIYDNDTTLVELSAASKTVAAEPSSSDAGKHRDYYQQQQQQQQRNKMGDFVNSDNHEHETDEKENYATCLLEPLAAAMAANVSGRLNFWQPLNNSGALHLLVRVRYRHNSTAPTTTTTQLRRRRESFRAPIERAPINATFNGIETLMRPRLRHTLTLLTAACGATANEHASSAGQLLAEASETSAGSPDAAGYVDLDAELVVAKFNLTGPTGITGKYLVFARPDGQPLGCCQVLASTILPPSELDNLPSISVVQPTRDDLLPDKLRGFYDKDKKY